MSNIHNPGPDTENLDLSIEEGENKNESTEIEGPQSIAPPTPMGNTDPTIRNH